MSVKAALQEWQAACEASTAQAARRPRQGVGGGSCSACRWAGASARRSRGATSFPRGAGTDPVAPPGAGSHRARTLTVATVSGERSITSPSAERPVFMPREVIDQRVVAVYFDKSRRRALANYGIQDGRVFDFVTAAPHRRPRVELPASSVPGHVVQALSGRSSFIVDLIGATAHVACARPISPHRRMTTVRPGLVFPWPASRRHGDRCGRAHDPGAVVLDRNRDRSRLRGGRHARRRSRSKTSIVRQIKLIVSFDAGNDYDQWARLLGRHLGKHLQANRLSWCRICPPPAARRQLSLQRCAQGRHRHRHDRPQPRPTTPWCRKAALQSGQVQLAGEPELTNQVCAAAELPVRKAEDLFGRGDGARRRPAIGAPQLSPGSWAKLC